MPNRWGNKARVVSINELHSVRFHFNVKWQSEDALDGDNAPSDRLAPDCSSRLNEVNGRRWRRSLAAIFNGRDQNELQLEGDAIDTDREQQSHSGGGGCQRRRCTPRAQTDNATPARQRDDTDSIGHGELLPEREREREREMPRGLRPYVEVLE